MGHYAQRYGFYGEDPQKSGAGEAILLADGNEVFVFHILSDGESGAVWVAQKLPDDEFTIVSNNFIIRDIDCDDKEDFICSDNLFEIQRKNNLWDPQIHPGNDQQKFDFLKVYGVNLPNFEYFPGYAPMPLYSTQRTWRMMRRVLGLQEKEIDTFSGLNTIDELIKAASATPIYPSKTQEINSKYQNYYQRKYAYGFEFPEIPKDSPLFDSFPPERPETLPMTVRVRENRRLSYEDLMSLYKDHYEGSELDQRLGAFQGNFGNPNRLELGDGQNATQQQFARGISIPRTTYVTIGISYPDDPTAPKRRRSLALFGSDTPSTSIWLPLYQNTDDKGLDHSFKSGHKMEFEWGTSMWWAMNTLQNYQESNYDYISHDADIKTREIQNRIRKDILDNDDFRYLSDDERKACKDKFTMIPKVGHFKAETRKLLETRKFLEAQPQKPAAVETAEVQQPEDQPVPKPANFEKLSQVQREAQQRVNKEWWTFLGDTIVRYNDGFYNLLDQDAQRIKAGYIGYKKEYLEELGATPVPTPKYVIPEVKVEKLLEGNFADFQGFCRKHDRVAWERSESVQEAVELVEAPSSHALEAPRGENKKSENNSSWVKYFEKLDPFSSVQSRISTIDRTKLQPTELGVLEDFETKLKNLEDSFEDQISKAKSQLGDDKARRAGESRGAYEKRIHEGKHREAKEENKETSDKSTMTMQMNLAGKHDDDERNPKDVNAEIKDANSWLNKLNNYFPFLKSKDQKDADRQTELSVVDNIEKDIEKIKHEIEGVANSKSESKSKDNEHEHRQEHRETASLNTQLASTSLLEVPTSSGASESTAAFMGGQTFLTGIFAGMLLLIVVQNLVLILLPKRLEESTPRGDLYEALKSEEV